MKNIYFRTEEAFQQQIEDHISDGDMVVEGIVQFEGGETQGAHVFSNQKLKCKLIFDEAAYHNASFQNKGE